MLENAFRYRQARQHIDQLHNNLRLLKTEYTRTKADLENRLRQSKQETMVYIQKLYETEQNESRAQQDAASLRRRLVKLREESEAELQHARAELQHSIEQVSQLTKQVAKMDTARVELEDRMQALEQEIGELRFQLAVAATAQADFATQASGSPATGARAGPDVAASSDLVSQIGCGVLLCDTRGQVSYANALAAQLLRCTEEQITGRSVFELWNDAPVRAVLHSAIDQHPPRPGTANDPSPAARVEPLLVEGGGQLVQIEVAPLYDGDRHTGAVISIHDVHKADARIRARDEFLASLAQELRTPMTSILGYTELLMSESVGKLEGIQRKFLQRVQANVERMRGMLSDLIGVTSIDSGKLVIELEPVDMVSVIETALRKAQFRLEEKELTAELDVGELSLIAADPEHIQQIMDNLLTNACKSSQPNSAIGIRAHVEVDDIGNSFLHVAVSDTGGGIAPQDHGRVFERFYRADNALIAGLGETGVGLAIVKSLVEAHHGHVWHESEMDVGTTFHFTLPLEQETESHSDASFAVKPSEETH